MQDLYVNICYPMVRESKDQYFDDNSTKYSAFKWNTRIGRVYFENVMSAIVRDVG